MHRISSLIVITVALVGCWTSRAPVDLDKVETRAVHFGLASPRSAICPGEPVGLHVLLDVVDPGDNGPPRRLKPHRIELDDAIFDYRQLHLSSPNGVFNTDGVFFPSPDVQATAQSGFVIYARAPTGPAFSVRFPPSYECRRTLGEPGRTGIAGNPGDQALLTDEPNLKRRNPTWSPPGGAGGMGGPGARGPTMRVHVTWVRTPDYTRLLAARASGDIDRVTLAAPGTPLEIIARGGDGGLGGRGGGGAPGVRYDEPGGPGGGGGRGGGGGHGGEVEVIIDDRFDDLERLLSIDVSGGQGGGGGAPGNGGRTGLGEHAAKRGVGYAERDGVVAPSGPWGAKGDAGDSGHVTVTRGSVAGRFDYLGAIVPL